MSLAAGELNRQIVIESKGETYDDANQPIDNWLPVAGIGDAGKLWAKVLGANGMSAVRASEEGIPIAPGKYSWRIRYRPAGITTAMRVNYKGVFFDIRDIRHDFDRQDYTDLVCDSGANNG